MDRILLLGPRMTFVRFRLWVPMPLSLRKAMWLFLALALGMVWLWLLNAFVAASAPTPTNLWARGGVNGPKAGTGHEMAVGQENPGRP
jgi:hypothetical protein